MSVCKAVVWSLTTFLLAASTNAVSKTVDEFGSLDSVKPKAGDTVLLLLKDTALKEFLSACGRTDEVTDETRPRYVMARVLRFHANEPRSGRMLFSAYSIERSNTGELRMIQVLGNAPTLAFRAVEKNSLDLNSINGDSAPPRDIYGSLPSEDMVPAFVLPISDFQHADTETVRARLTVFAELEHKDEQSIKD